MKTWQKIKNNLELLPKYLIRESVYDTIRSFFKSDGFHEVETPILVSVPSIEPNLEVFETKLKTLTGKERRSFLIMSPEYSLKKLLAAGIGNIFEITKAFRNNEEVSDFHNPEFTILEWYRVGASYLNIMDDFENLFRKIIVKVNPQVDLAKWEYQGKFYDLGSPWLRISVADAFQKYVRIDIDTLLSEQKLKEVAGKLGYKIDEKTTWDEIFCQILFDKIEPEFAKLGKPVFLYDYPASQAALAKKKVSDPRFAERFEVFLAGMELGNCFSELIDADEQKQRFESERQERSSLGKTDYEIDEDLIEALKSGLPEVSGIAVGVDRLIMLASNTGSISETLFFPAGEMFDL